MRRDRLLTGGWSRAAPSVAVASALLVLAVGAWIDGRRSTSVDLAVDRALRPVADAGRPVLAAAVDVVTPGAVLAVCGALVLSCLLVDLDWRGAAFAVGGPALALGAGAALKKLLDRPSATLVLQGEAYPSGHTTASAALVVVVLVLVRADAPLGRAVPGTVRRAVRWGAVAAAGWLALALTALRHHYVTDVVGGVGTALAGTLLGALVVDRLPPFDAVARRVLGRG